MRTIEKAGFAFLLAAAPLAHAVPDPGCPAPVDAEFKLTTLISRDAQNQLEEPIKMALDADDHGNITIYFVQRYGKIRAYDVADRSLKTIGTIPVDVKLEDGITGIVLDPGFKSNRWLYLYYGTGTASDWKYRLSRFHLDGAGMLDMASERPILEIPAQKGLNHTGGSMQFDPQGNLYLGVGENAGGELSAANTNDLRGKILRIKPIAFPDAQRPRPGPGSTYAIPEGNLFAASDKTRPEVYIMGDRNPYTLTLDFPTGRLAWGELGPNGTDTTEEDDITLKPGNFGYPYYAGRQVPVTPNPGSPAAPINANAKNTGLRELPPAVPAARAYLRSAAITGPIYRYAAAPAASTIKLPPRFDGLWFVTDFNTGEIDTIRLDASGTAVARFGRVFPGMRLSAPLDFKQGPDGALYVVNYGGYFSSTPATSLARIEYAGSCRPDPSSARSGAAAKAPPFGVRGFLLESASAGPYRFSIRDAGGRLLAEAHGNGPLRYDARMDLGGRAGIYVVKWECASGLSARRVFLGP